MSAPVYIGAPGLYAPGFRGTEAWLGGMPDPECGAPSHAILPSRLRRGASLVTRALIDVTEQSIRASGLDLAHVHLVYGSAFGEVETALILISQQDPNRVAVSPARFKSSVHNTAAGLTSIASGNHLPATTIAAGEDTVAMALFEGLLLLRTNPSSPVLVAVAEEPVPKELRGGRAYDLFAASFILSAEPVQDSPIRVQGFGRVPGAMPPEPFPPGLEHSPVASALHLAIALTKDEPEVRLTVGATNEAPYVIELAPERKSA